MLTFGVQLKELAAWLLAAVACSWPEPHAGVTGGARSGRYTRIAVLADPQLTDLTSYSALPSGPLLQVLTTPWMSDVLKWAGAIHAFLRIRAEDASPDCL